MKLVNEIEISNNWANHGIYKYFSHHTSNKKSLLKSILLRTVKLSHKNSPFELIFVHRIGYKAVGARNRKSSSQGQRWNKKWVTCKAEFLIFESFEAEGSSIYYWGFSRDDAAGSLRFFLRPPVGQLHQPVESLFHILRRFS